MPCWNTCCPSPCRQCPRSNGLGGMRIGLDREVPAPRPWPGPGCCGRGRRRARRLRGSRGPRSRRPGPTRDDVERLRREEEKLRARRISLLKARLERARAEVRDLEVELRRAGVSGEELGGDRTNWNRIFDELPATFTVTQLHAATGA